jgi:hypothetical protein
MTLTKYDIISGIAIIILLTICVYRHRRDLSFYSKPNTHLGLQELIEQVKSELIDAEKERINKNQQSLFILKDFDLEIKFTVNEKHEKSGKIEYEVVTIGGNESVSLEKVQTIKLHMIADTPSKYNVGPSDTVNDSINKINLSPIPLAK